MRPPDYQLGSGALRLWRADALSALREMPEASVQCVVTSPPYWGLRDYGTARWEGGDPSCDHRQETIRVRRGLAEAANACDGGSRSAEGRSDKDALGLPYRETCGKCGARRVDAQLGLEPSPEAYLSAMVEVFREVRRVLRRDGTCWVNMGDSYANCDKGGYAKDRVKATDSMQASNLGANFVGAPNRKAQLGLKPKDLVGIPWRLALAMQADGWWLRSDIVWAKPNPMPESVTDRPTKSHEYVFLFSKAERYYYDAVAVKEAHVTPQGRREKKAGARPMRGQEAIRPRGNLEATGSNAERYWGPGGRNLRSVWTMTTRPFREAHFATFPPELPERCIKAASSAKGACPACGAPWARVVERGEPDRAHQRACGGGIDGGYVGGALKNYAAAGAQDASATKARILAGMTTSATIGWRPTCKCGREDVAPCVVMDPFAGAGTTLLVAGRLGRDAVGIELNRAYCEMAVRRCRETFEPPLFAEAGG
jgi:DNA modification methylase